MKNYLGKFTIEQHEFSGYEPGDWAQYYISEYGYIDGSHHKQWVLDQVMRILLGTPVIVTEARWSDGFKELRFKTGCPSDDYLAWIGKGIDDDEAIGTAP